MIKMFSQSYFGYLQILKQDMNFNNICWGVFLFVCLFVCLFFVCLLLFVNLSCVYVFVSVFVYLFVC